ncbi:uncharacterized protein BXZ73DRAFT_53631 [Epithele typhae]|uniref:uncharacterized protein n=1 Tax=Epithele typhae TaxID=378194 RepID=UPI0020072464|nr:uncharacterized protein BXZ73DRAFT_53631 [Epithele typhae]KAH9916742.1 hypothetical protein BXZ73DRAFT_53631 [Epithele typhae]
MDVDSLSPTQRDALSQIQALTNGGDSEVAIGVLSSVNWDVQRAAEIIFDGAHPPPQPVSPPRREEFEIDDSEQQGLLGGRRGGREFRPVDPAPFSVVVMRPLRVMFNILAIPLYPLFSLIRFLFRALHIPLPNIGPFSFSYRTLGPAPGRGARDPKTAAERWVRALEEETGAVCVGRAAPRKSSQTNGHSTASGVAGPSSLTTRPGPWEGSESGESKLLPDFFLGSYEDFARTCQRELKIGCIVIVSEEHDDDAEFKRSTLTDPSFLRVIQENDMFVWGGDIRDRDAWQASQKLHATTYPFVAFIALQPRRTPSSSAPPAPALTILSRHQGPSIPSTSAPTAAETLVSHLTDSLLPRVTPFLNKLRLEAAERDRERTLRAEQDRAFEESARKDAERITARRREQREAQEAQQRAADAEARAEEQRRAAAAAHAQWAAHRMAWRRWIRRGLVVREPRPGEAARGKTLRVGVRMPDGRRAVRFFGEEDRLTALYAYVDAMFVPPELVQDADPVAPPAGGAAGEGGLVAEMERAGKNAEKWWGFRLALAYPRKEIAWEAGKRIGDVEALRGGGQVVVEAVEDEASTKAKGKGKSAAQDDDEYDTESD